MMSTVSCAPSLRASSRAAGRAADDDQPARAADPGRDQAHHTDRAGTLHDDGVADFDSAAQRGMHADCKRLGQNAHLRRRLRLDDARIRVGQVDVVGEPATEGLARAAVTGSHDSVAGMENDTVSLSNQGAVIVGGHAIAQGFDHADVFVAQHRCPA